MANKISPISGFPEYLPAQQLAFNGIVSKIRSVYESFGYVPLETPAVERIDTLISKGIDSKEVYALRRLNTQGEGDDGAKDLALKFDLTVPLARYVSQHYANLTFPFRRYQVQPVWRGERAKAGRYRQFYQFDIDYIADSPLPLAADAEILAAAHQALTSLGLKFRMRINNRKLLIGLLQEYKFSKTAEALKVIDDLEKIGTEKVMSNLEELEPSANAKGFLADIRNFMERRPLASLNATAQEGANEIEQVRLALEVLLGRKTVDDTTTFDITIARGLDYYTGTVVETTLLDAPELGSICSGGRYENLAESLSDRKLPGVGISIGLSRLFSWMETQPQFAPTASTTAQVFIPLESDAALPAATAAAGNLRAAGLMVEQSLHAQPLPTQYQKAEKRGLKYAAIPEENGKVTLRTFATRSNQSGLTPAEVAAKLKQ